MTWEFLAGVGWGLAAGLAVACAVAAWCDALLQRGHKALAEAVLVLRTLNQSLAAEAKGKA